MKKENKDNKEYNNENCIEKNEHYSNIEHTKESEDYNSRYCINEKKIIIYLIIIALALIYYSLFFIHNINFRGTLKNTQSIEIEYPHNNDEDNSIDFNNSQGSNITNGIVNNNLTNSIINNNITNNNSGTGQVNNPEENIVDNPEENIVNSPEENIVNNKDRFKILQGTKNWKELKSLDIFNNYYFNDQSIIAPGVHGEYSFTVENYRQTKMKYNLEFSEENMYNINMFYKLKLNGAYIAGSEQNFVRCDELDKEDLVINANTNDVFTIEWKWQDNNNDTQIGETEGANYKMQIKIDAYELVD